MSLAAYTACIQALIVILAITWCARNYIRQRRVMRDFMALDAQCKSAQERGDFDEGRRLLAAMRAKAKEL